MVAVAPLIRSDGRQSARVWAGARKVSDTFVAETQHRLPKIALVRWSLWLTRCIHDGGRKAQHLTAGSQNDRSDSSKKHNRV